MFKKALQNSGLWIASILIYIIMQLLWLTARKKYHFIDEVEPRQYIGLCWHSELLFSVKAYKTIHPKCKTYAMISAHKDGTIIARVLGLLGIASLRGSSSKNAAKVLIQAFKRVKQGDNILITPDGPRGPRHSMSQGPLAIAQKSGVPLMLLNYIPSRYWQLNSWDKFVIPKPFATVDLYIQTLSIDDGMQEEALQKKMMAHTLA